METFSAADHLHEVFSIWSFAVHSACRNVVRIISTLHRWRSDCCCLHSAAVALHADPRRLGRHWRRPVLLLSVIRRNLFSSGRRDHVCMLSSGHPRADGRKYPTAQVCRRRDDALESRQGMGVWPVRPVIHLRAGARRNPHPENRRDFYLPPRSLSQMRSYLRCAP